MNWSNFNSVFGEPSAALLTTSNPSQIIGEFSKCLSAAVLKCPIAKTKASHVPQSKNEHERWSNLLKEKSGKDLWCSIGWNGALDTNRQSDNRPSDRDFAEHFSKLFNPDDPTYTEHEHYCPEAVISVPVLDSPITPYEVHQAIAKMKAGASTGHDGIPTRALKRLPVSWLVVLTALFCAV